MKLPRFKKRRSKQTARFTLRGFQLHEDKVYLAKIGCFKVVWSRPLPGEPSSVTVIKDSAHRYFLSFVVEIQPQKLPESSKSVGIDLGISTLFSNGKKVDAPKPLKKRIKKYRKLSKSLSKKSNGSKRYEKARLRVAKFSFGMLRKHSKLKDTRTDFLHKLFTEIIRENQTIILEDLNVSGMMKNRKLSRAISDLGWRQFRTLLVGHTSIPCSLTGVRILSVTWHSHGEETIPYGTLARFPTEYCANILRSKTPGSEHLCLSPRWGRTAVPL
ncbi:MULTISPECIES: transposase [unclassified Okeania]|uniref:RNA-guided endonuclease InsQ/TnpB family protein n=1 Tax=unclassified Okeania TaxID=2634635 RepID=UPI00257D3BA5|nr:MULTISPECIES: transposase [unclassified Okeania]